MAELLIKAKDAPGYQDMVQTNPKKANGFLGRKGDVIEVGHDGQFSGPYWKQSKECPPNYVTIKVMATTTEDLLKFKDTWETEIEFDEKEYDPATDTYTYDIKIKAESASGLEGKIDRKAAREWVEKRGNDGVPRAVFKGQGPEHIMVEFTPHNKWPLQKFLERGQVDLAKRIRRRKYIISSSDVDAILLGVGFVEWDLPYLENRINSKLDSNDGF